MVNDGANVAAPAQETQAVSPAPAPVSTEQASVNTQPAQESTPSTQEVVEEKVLKQSEVNKIVAREKREAREKALLEVEQRSLESAQRHQDQINSGQVQGDAPLTRNDLIKMQQEAAQKAQESFVKEVQSTFGQKLEAFQKEDPTFTKEVMAVLPGDIVYNAALMHGLNGLDNAKDVLKEMANHPAKYEDIQVAARNNPQWGLQRLYALSSSIKANQEAKKQPVATPPLNQIKPSPTGKDSGKLTVDELRRLPQYRV